MSEALSRGFEHALSRLVVTASRWAIAIVLLSFIGTYAALDYTVKHVGISTDTGEMFSPELPFRKAWQQYKDAFPKHIDTFVVVIDGESPQQARQKAAQLAERLQQYPQLFDDIDTPGVGDFYDTNGLLFLDTPELKDLSNRLALVQPLLAKLSDDPTMRGLFSVVDKALDEEKGAAADVDILQLLQAMNKTLATPEAQRYPSLPWQELMTGKVATINDKRAFLIIRPFMDFGLLFPAEQAFATVRDEAEKLNINQANDMQIRLTGELAMEYDELHSVSEGAAESALITVFIALVILYLAFRSAKLMTATLLTLFVGLIFTAAFATWAVGTLNMISVAFAVLYIGLSLDFTIHFGLRYREWYYQSHQPIRDALGEAARRTGAPLLLCTITTAVGFYAFIPTDYDGVSELGLISGTGMFISFILTMTLFPALLSLQPFKLKKIQQSFPSGLPKPLLALSADTHHPLWRGIFIALIVASLFCMPFVKFDYNPLNLRSAHSESVSTFVDLIHTSDPSPWYMTILMDDLQQAESLKKQLGQLSTVDKVVTLKSYVPTQQDEKLDSVDEISLIMGTQLSKKLKTASLDANQAKESLHDFRDQLNLYLSQEPPGKHAAVITTLRDNVDALLKADLSTTQLQALQQALVGTLPANLSLLGKSMNADYVSLESLPEKLKQQWISNTHKIRVAVFPKQDIADSEALREFVDQVRGLVPTATGAPVNYLESGDAVVKAFNQAITGAIIVISLLLLVILRSVRDTLYTLIPLIIAGIFTAALTTLLDIPFNFANIIALPLLLGIGVDNGIHMVQRFHANHEQDEDLMNSSTARGIFFSALTTVVSFLSLAFSAHPGTASMGLLLTTGMLLTLIATLVVLPSLLKSK